MLLRIQIVKILGNNGAWGPEIKRLTIIYKITLS